VHIPKLCCCGLTAPKARNKLASGKRAARSLWIAEKRFQARRADRNACLTPFQGSFLLGAGLKNSKTR
jgi:hypothetical protein